MDKATIEAMRKVIEGCANRLKVNEKAECCAVVHGHTMVPIAVFRHGVESLRMLVDQAEAEQPQAPSEPDGRDVLKTMRDLLYALDQTTRKAEKEGDVFVSFKATDYSYRMYTVNARAAVRAIEAMLDAKPTTTGEPTLEECLAAINLEKRHVRGAWEIRAINRDNGSQIKADDLRAIGSLLIDRERTEAAKGGA